MRYMLQAKEHEKCSFFLSSGSKPVEALEIFLDSSGFPRIESAQQLGDDSRSSRSCGFAGAQPLKQSRMAMAGLGGKMRDLFDIFRIGPGGATWCEEAGDAATAMRRAAARANAEHCEYLIVSESTGERTSYRPQQADESRVNSWVEKPANHMVEPTIA
jgi:hypothetical protein